MYQNISCFTFQTIDKCLCIFELSSPSSSSRTHKNFHILPINVSLRFVFNSDKALALLKSFSSYFLLFVGSLFFQWQNWSSNHAGVMLPLCPLDPLVLSWWPICVLKNKKRILIVFWVFCASYTILKAESAYKQWASVIPTKLNRICTSAIIHFNDNLQISH